MHNKLPCWISPGNNCCLLVRNIVLRWIKTAGLAEYSTESCILPYSTELTLSGKLFWRKVKFWVLINIQQFPITTLHVDTDNFLYDFKSRDISAQCFLCMMSWLLCMYHYFFYFNIWSLSTYLLIYFFYFYLIFSKSPSFLHFTHSIHVVEIVEFIHFHCHNRKSTCSLPVLT